MTLARFEAHGGDYHYGIFLKSSRFNHACYPYANCTFRWHADQKRLVFTTSRNVVAREEMTISYIGKSPDATILLPESYGFWCDCPGCPPGTVAKAQAEMRSKKTVSSPTRGGVSDGVMYHKGGYTILEDSWEED